MRRNSPDDLNIFLKIFVFIMLGLVILLALSFVAGILFFGFAGFFKIFGVEYESISSLMGFVGFYFILGFILDIFSIAFKGLASNLVSGKYSSFIVFMLIECFFSWIAIYTVDEFMDGITIPLLTELAAVFFLFLIEEAFGRSENGKE